MMPARRVEVGAARIAAVVMVAVVLALASAAAVAGPAGAADETPTTSVLSTEPPAAQGDDTGLGDLDAGSTTPSPRGQPEPPRAQRLADSAIAVFVLVVLVGGVAVAVWTGRRRSSVGSDDPVVGPRPER